MFLLHYYKLLVNKGVRLHARKQNSPRQHHRTMDLKLYMWHYKCNCLAKLWHEVVYIKGAVFVKTGPLIPTFDLPIQITKFTSTHIDQTIQKNRQLWLLNQSNQGTRFESQPPHIHQCKKHKPTRNTTLTCAIR